MMRQKIQNAIRNFSQDDLFDAAIRLFQTLGYDTERQNRLDHPTYQEFSESYLKENDSIPDIGKFGQKALTDHWERVELLFQLSESEMTDQEMLSDTKKIDNTIIEAYLFFAIELKDADYSRTELSDITRQMNRVFPMPVMLLFRYGEYLTLSVIKRRLHKRDESRDVLEKVTLVKDIRIADPHRAHIEILSDLDLDALGKTYTVTNFVALHNAWQKVLDCSELNKKFYGELANWYFWALQNVDFPKDGEANEEIRNATAIIRLLTRLIFVWFVREKGLIPKKLFDKNELDSILNFRDKNRSTFYKAILQNLFFATLNQEQGKRAFRRKGQNYNVTNLYRYEHLFEIGRDEVLKLFEEIPFLNGGLFDCLDKPHPTKKGPRGGDRIIRIDGFSDRDDNPLRVPDFLFFAEEKNFDLNKTYGTGNKKYEVRGLINLLDKYKFTIAENTPVTEEIALDPELLGRVFENLLASYNPETETTARKQTGSFYTPREIVDYMADESLKASLSNLVAEKVEDATEDDIKTGLDVLFAYTEKEHAFTDDEVSSIVEAVSELKILDPACGSGAFPMGILHKLVFILGKLDSDNSRWRDLQKQRAIRETETAYNLGDRKERQQKLQEIEKAFDFNTSDYGRKLYLIENSIYGVDIQPVAVQISMLRFFISLIAEQIPDKTRENFGIRPLPNLETKFVAANTLIKIEKPKDNRNLFDNPETERLENRLKEIRHSHFSAKTPRTKRKYRKEDKETREKIAKVLASGFGDESTAKQLASWNPYNQNTSAEFFDPEWMFGIRDGFDIVIGNPPYINATDFKNIYGTKRREEYKKIFRTSKGTYDVFVLFFEKGMELLKNNGQMSLITPNKYLSAKYATALRAHMLNCSTVQKLVDLSSVNVFSEISVYPVITVLRKHVSTEKKHVSVLQPVNRQDAVFDTEKFKTVFVEYDMLTMLADNLWGFLLSDKADYLQSFIDGTEPLSEYGEINATSTASEAESYGMHFSNDKGKDTLKVINTGTIDRYASLWGIKALRHRGSSYVTPFLPLDKANVISRRKAIYRSPKILFAKMAVLCEAFLDSDGDYASVNTNCFHAPKERVSLKYLAAYCNSKLFMFFYEQFFGALRMSGGYFQFQAPQLRVVPTLHPTAAGVTAMFESKADHITALKKESPDADTAELEKQIDLMVYKLYDLTYEEVRIVDPDIEKIISEKEYNAKRIDNIAKKKIRD
ncbi:Eco57I restriction-modification methylase domain-containing protein [Desulfobacterales bacterium HSG2]|nr:Eco57I restriction-modification methylase domain-containing protein [Desulfobacterales bacterium HSG2]